MDASQARSVAGRAMSLNSVLQIATGSSRGGIGLNGAAPSNVQKSSGCSCPRDLSGPPADRHLQARKRLAPGQAGREHLIDRRPLDEVPAAGLHLARQPSHHAALELFDVEHALIAALEVEATENEEAALHGFERRQDGRQREVGFAAGRRPFLRDRAARRVDREETLGRVWRRGGPRRPPADHRFQPGERDRDAARSLEHRTPAET